MKALALNLQKFQFDLHKLCVKDVRKGKCDSPPSIVLANTDSNKTGFVDRNGVEFRLVEMLHDFCTIEYH